MRDLEERNKELERLIIQCRHWLAILIEQMDIDPAETEMEARILDKNQQDVVQPVNLQQTLSDIDALMVTVVTRADNDG